MFKATFHPSHRDLLENHHRVRIFWEHQGSRQWRTPIIDQRQPLGLVALGNRMIRKHLCCIILVLWPRYTSFSDVLYHINLYPARFINSQWDSSSKVPIIALLSWYSWTSGVSKQASSVIFFMRHEVVWGGQSYPRSEPSWIHRCERRVRKTNLEFSRSSCIDDGCWS